MSRRRLILFVAIVVLSSLITTKPAAADGATFLGSAGGQQLNAPVIGMAATATDNGYWLVGSDGGIFTFGDAAFFGSRGGQPLAAPIVGMTARGNTGYWLVASDGGIFAYGRASFFGSTGGMNLNRPIVGMVATPSGNGYWLVASDGGIFAFGDAAFFGSTGSLTLNAPIVGIARTANGNGYWLVASDGGIFAFGNAAFLGSTGSIKLNAPIVGIARTPAGSGYWLVGSDGGIFTFGDAAFFGSTGDRKLQASITGIAAPGSGPGYWLVARDGGVFAFPTPAPTLTVTQVVGGLEIPWDVDFTPDGTMLFTERPGRIRALVGGNLRTLYTVPDIFVGSEGGLLGMTVDPNFASTRRIYACYTWTNGTTRDARVSVWTINADYTSATRIGNLITGLPVSSGRHSGCRPRVGNDGYLWIGTGDAAQGTNPQDLNSLGGKTLRIDRASGAPAVGNPFGTPVWTWGHRNVQGLALQDSTGRMFSVEHGPDRDDEINIVQGGGNYGWDPVPGYNESVPMTDTNKFPNAISAVWSSGPSTIATSGADFVTGPAWKSWDGALAVACLAGQQLRFFFLNSAGVPVSQEIRLTNQGRLRTPTLGPDGSLYVTTSNGGGNDKILKVTPV